MEQSGVFLTDNEIRKDVLERRNRIPHREERSLAIMQKLRNSSEYQKVSVILAYSSIGSEVDTNFLLSQTLKDNKILYLPKVTDTKNCKMEFYKLNSLEDVYSGYYNIKEPISNICFNPQNEPALMIVPCVAFDRNGTRLGYGKGYYDRYLTSCGRQIKTILLAFKEQEVDFIKRKTTDIPIPNRMIG